MLSTTLTEVISLQTVDYLVVMMLTFEETNMIQALKIGLMPLNPEISKK